MTRFVDRLWLNPGLLGSLFLQARTAQARLRLSRQSAQWLCFATSLFVAGFSVPAVGETALAVEANATSTAITDLAATNSSSVAETNNSQKQPSSGPKLPPEISEAARERLESARHYRHIRQPREAESLLVGLMAEALPEVVKRQALYELAGVAIESGDLVRAQQIYAQYLNRWPNDLMIPEVLLSQGRLFRSMGMDNLALAKFYAVMTSSLVLKNDRLDYYERIVLAAQTEIAETHFQLGKYAEAADFYSRLLKQSNPALDRLNAQYRLIRSLSAVGRDEETIAQGTDFITRHSRAAEQPEVRFLIALALKRLGRNGESLQQVLSLLQEQKERTKEHPELWAYWQQEAGNEVGNQLYREGDYARALSVYLVLAKLNPHPSWQLPVDYQIGLTYERLAQPHKAIEMYQSITRHESGLGTNAIPSLQPVLEMARWRSEFVQWQMKAEFAANNAARPPDLTPSTPSHSPASPSTP